MCENQSFLVAFGRSERVSIINKRVLKVTHVKHILSNKTIDEETNELPWDAGYAAGWPYGRPFWAYLSRSAGALHKRARSRCDRNHLRISPSAFNIYLLDLHTSVARRTRGQTDYLRSLRLASSAARNNVIFTSLVDWTF